MSRKHFRALARALYMTHASPATVAAVADVLATFNPRFDRTLFTRAASEGTIPGSEGSKSDAGYRP